MTPKIVGQNIGPSLNDYVETRLNIITENIARESGENKAAILALKEILNAALIAADLRYQQRFDAQSDAIAAAFASQQVAMSTALVTAEKAVLAAQASADRAVSKAEIASDKRFDGVNEFRQTLSDQQQTFMPRLEANALFNSITDKLTVIKEQVDRLSSERIGVKGGWGYAIGIMGTIFAMITLLFYGLRFMKAG